MTRRRACPRMLMIAVLGVLWGPAASVEGQIIDRIVAVVDGRVILLSDVRAAIELRLEVVTNPERAVSDVVQRLIDRELMLAEVDRYAPPAPSATVIEARMQEVRVSYASDDAYLASLADLGMGEVELRGRIRDDLRIAEYLEQRFGSTARPTDEAILRYYREHRADFVRSDEVVSLADAEPAIRVLLSAQQRRVLIESWVTDLRRRGVIMVPDQ